MRCVIIGLAGVVLGFSESAWAQIGNKATMDLKSVAGSEDLSDRAMRVIAEKGFVLEAVRSETLNEIAQSASSGALITTDWVTDAYGRLFSRCVMSLEYQQSRVLGDFLRQCLEQGAKKGDKNLDSILPLLGMAIHLLEPGWVGSPDARCYVDEGKAVIRRWRSDGVRCVLNDRQFAFSLIELDPRLLEACGLYRSSPRLRRYFAARRLLQMVPIVASSGARRKSIDSLRALVQGDAHITRLHKALCSPMKEVFGPPAEPGLLAEVDGEVARRVLPRYETLDSFVFKRVTHPNVQGRYFPSGLDLLAVGSMACDVGREVLKGSGELLKQIDRIEVPASALDSHFGAFVRAQKNLVKYPADGRWKLVDRDSWLEFKSLSQLVGWVSVRRAGELQVSAPFVRLARRGRSDPTVIVEPYPEYFNRLAICSGEMALCADRMDRGLDPSDVALDLAEAMGEFSRDRLLAARLNMLFGYWGVDRLEGEERVRAMLKRVRQSAGNVSVDDRKSLSLYVDGGEPIAECFRALERVCRDLSAWARDPNAEEYHRRGAVYVTKLAAEFKNAIGCLSVRHDPDGVDVSVARTPEGRVRGVLRVGLSRPCALYVLVSLECTSDPRTPAGRVGPPSPLRDVTCEGLCRPDAPIPGGLQATVTKGMRWRGHRETGERSGQDRLQAGRRAL